METDRRINTEISDEIKRLVPILGKEKASKLETAYLLADEDSRKRIIEMIDTLKAAVFTDEDMKNAVLMEAPPEDLVKNGKIEFGTVLYGKKKLYPIFLDEETFLTHIGIFGSSGYGKTNLVQWLIINLAKNEIPILIFDFSKRNYRDLLSLPELKDRIKVYTVGRNVSPFRFNPLSPPEGVQISQWAKEFSEVFDHAYWMMGGGRHIILKALDEIYNASSPNMPKIKNLKDWLERYADTRKSPRERNWIATAERPLESLCFREVGDIFDCDKGIPPSELFKKGSVTILELDSLSTNDKTFFIEIMLQWIRDAALVTSVREKLIGIVVLEEAHHVLNREKSKTLGMETVIDLIFREVRELGIGMIYVDQHPSLISYPALGNTSTHIYMNLGLDTKYSSDIMDASNMLGLKYEDEGDYLRRLPIGHSFILMRRLAFPNPFLVEFPLVNVKKGSVNDEIVKMIMQDKIIDDIKKLREKIQKVETITLDKPIVTKDLDETDWKIIETIGNAKGSSTSEIYSLISMSGGSFKKRAEKLLEMGLIGFSVGKVFKQKANYYFLTDYGQKTFESKFQRQIEEVESDKETLKDFVINFFTLKGCRVLDNKDNQVFFDKDGKRIVVNIELNNGNIDMENLTKQEELYFLCANDIIKNSVVQQIAKHTFEKKLSNLIHMADIKELEKGNEFKRIEFNPE